MKKYATTTLVFLLAACSSAQDMTIEEMMFAEDPIAETEVIPHRQTTAVKTETVKIPTEVPASAEPEKYRKPMAETQFREETVSVKEPAIETVIIPEPQIVEIPVEVPVETATKVVELREQAPAVQPAPTRLQTREERYDNPNIMPQVYSIAATRATNKMLDESAEFYETPNGNVFLYIAEIKKADRRLPDGIYAASRTTRKIIEGSKTFKVVNDKSEADYYLETVIDNAGTPEEPILVYKLVLFDNQNNKINEWVETIRRVRNDDRSWW